MIELPKRKPQRLKEFDYSLSGYYFITICMKNRTEFFSHIVNDNVVLTEYGKILDDVWTNLKRYYKVEVDDYVIMPDHFHGIIIIDSYSKVRDEKEMKRFSLSEIIGKFKSYTARSIRELLKNKNDFEWQKSFYDRIIRNEKELYHIRKYIHENPLRWELEKDNPENLDF